MKSTHIQIRISPEQKNKIAKAASRKGVGMTTWVLEKLFPELSEKLEELIQELAKSKNSSFVFAEINDFLSALSSRELSQALENLNLEKLEVFEQNYLAAMIELACEKKSIACPEITTAELSSPWFATELESLKLYLLLNSPAPFRKRNIFIDSSIGDRC